MTVRVAAIGAGVMGADHARIVAEDVPGAVLQVVCDTDITRARQVAAQFGAADAASDAAAVIARSDVDAVIIASPDTTHATLTLACIDARKPVLCEKPLSQDPADCLAVIDAESATGRRFVQVGFMRRFDQSYTEMKTALTRGMLGRALMMHNFHRNVETPLPGFTGAMAITNSAPHEFDAARFVLGCEITAVSAFQPRRDGPLAAPVFMVLETAKDQIVTVEINNNAAYGYDVRGELVGETGAMSLETPVHSRLDTGLRAQTSYAADWRPRFADAYRRQMKAFLHFAAVGDFPEAAASSRDGYAASAVAEAGVRALASGRRVCVDMPGCDRTGLPDGG